MKLSFNREPTAKELETLEQNNKHRRFDFKEGKKDRPLNAHEAKALALHLEGLSKMKAYEKAFSASDLPVSELVNRANDFWSHTRTKRAMRAEAMRVKDVNYEVKGIENIEL